MSPAKALARVDTVLLYPAFLERLVDMLLNLDELGAEFVGLSGFRKMSEQAQLYFQGRTTAGKIVTKAQAGYSSHNFGIGCDFGRFFGSRYSEEPADYEVLGEEAKRAGLVWGGAWAAHDAQHVQWPGYVTATQLQPLKDIYDARTVTAGTDWLKDVWSYVTANSETNPNIRIPPEENT